MHDEFLQGNAAQSLHMLGISPRVPYYDLYLAGSSDVQATSLEPTSSTDSQGNPPTFSLPDPQAPPLAPYNLAEPGVTVYAAFTADPFLPRLSQEDYPYGLNVHPDTPVEPGLAALYGLDEPPEGATMTRDVTEPEFSLPDLHHPILALPVQMPERPASLAASALQTMRQDATYQLLAQKEGSPAFTDQSGMNNTRSRHMGLLLHGLEAEEE